MQALWAPWRKAFIYQRKARGCIFCQKPGSAPKDKENLVVQRGKTTFTILNLFPYNNGHLMIAPYRHLKNVTLLTKEEMTEMFTTTQEMIRRLDRVLKPHGYNVGFNIGRAAGAGFDKHIHLHIVPRWRGDTNFMPVLAGQKVMSESLQDLRRRLFGGR